MNKPDCFIRFIGQVEVMSPLFGIEALKICLPSFIENKSSWGIDSVWSKLLGYPKDKLAVVDEVQMKHIHPVGGGELYKKIQVDPYDEMNFVVQKYGAIKNHFIEHGRYMVVNNDKNMLLKSVYHSQARATKLKKGFIDYWRWYAHQVKNNLGFVKKTA